MVFTSHAERFFLELELEVLLNRLKCNLEQVSEAQLRTVYKHGYETLLYMIRKKAEIYLKEEIFRDLGGHVLSREEKRMYQDLNQALHEESMIQRLRHALYMKPDMCELRKVVNDMRDRAAMIVNKYQSHAKGGNLSESGYKKSAGKIHTRKRTDSCTGKKEIQ